MSHRIEQVNDLLRLVLANFISEHIALNNGLITISCVDCSPDLKNAKISVSVLPENLRGTALHELKKHNSHIIKWVKANTRLRVIPKLNWLIDDSEERAAEIDELLAGK